MSEISLLWSLPPGIVPRIPSPDLPIRMNILILSLRGPTNDGARGGANEVLRNVGESWVKRGHHVRILCCHHKSIRFPPSENLAEVEVLRSGRRLTAIADLARRYRAHREWADIVFENMLELPLLTPLYVRRPLAVITHHLLGAGWFSIVPWHQALVGFLGERALPLMYRNTNFVAVSEQTQDDLFNVGIRSKNVRVVHWAVNHQLYRPGGSKTEHPTLLFVGLLDNGLKRVEDLFLVIDRVRQQYPQAELIIVGSGNKGKELRLRAEGKNIQVLGFVDEAEKIRLFQRSWVHVIPSIKEGFGLTALEASACGTPIVAYDAPGLIGVKAGVNGLKVPVGDWASLADSICETIQDSALRNRLTAGGLEFARQRTWEDAAGALLDVIVNK